MSAPPPAPRRTIPLGRRLVYALVLVCLTLGVAEGVLRLTLPTARRVTLPNEMIRAHLEGAAFVYHPDLGWYWENPGGSGSPVNAYGFVRSERMEKKRPPGVTRVITFGDSQTFGAGMRPDQTYSAVAEATLGDDWEVLNAGLSGFRTLNVYRLLRLRMLAFEPNAVIIDCMPFDSPKDDGSLQSRPLVQSPVDAARGLLWHSRLYYVLRLGLEVLNPDRARWLDETDAAKPRIGPREPGRPYDEAQAGNHDLILEWGRDNGVEVFFMQYPIMDEHRKYGCMTGKDELPAGARIIPACDRITESGLPARDLFQDRNHLTEIGNQIVGKIVADSLREWGVERAAEK